MPHRSASEILDESFLLVRAKLLEVAATLDRIDQAGNLNAITSDQRTRQIQQAIEILSLSADDSATDRANQIQQLFSRPYDADWRTTMEV